MLACLLRSKFIPKEAVGISSRSQGPCSGVLYIGLSSNRERERDSVHRQEVLSGGLRAVGALCKQAVQSGSVGWVCRGGG